MVLRTLKNPDEILFDKETGYFIAVRKIDNKLCIAAYVLTGDVSKVVSAFLTSKLNIVENRIRKGRWIRL